MRISLLRRVSGLCFCCAAIVSFWGSAARSWAESKAGASRAIPLVAAGDPRATLIAPADASGATTRALDDLVQFVRQSSGATLPIETTSVDNRLELHIGLTPYVKSLKLPLDDLGVDGFRIVFPSPNRVVLIGGSESGTEFAIYDFLERYVGVRWLFPGDLGTYVPKSRDIAIPTGEVVSRPAFISRIASSVDDPAKSIGRWQQRHRIHWTIQHHHNLNNLFAPKEYFKTHPEFYPNTDGKEPAADGDGWQPVLDAKGIVEEAVKKITAYFDEYPNNPSYSLGVNDNNNFGRPAQYTNSVGLADYSDYYFQFTNRVIEGVLKKHPDKWFGCLAYVGVTDPPRKIGVNPRMVPYICIDRQGWASEEGARRDMERTEKWHKAAPVLGWYDYIYGGDMYRVPRIYTHLMGRYLKYASEHGVKAYYAELYESPAWTEGPKPYVVMKLLWDPNADVDAIQTEWYRLAVGEKAAAPLAKYYQLWEDYWMQRVPKTDWFKQYVNSTYFDFDHTGYLDELTLNDLAECKRLMGEVVAAAETPEQRARAEFMAKGLHDLLRDVDYHVRLRDKTAATDAKSAIIADSFYPPGEADEKVPLPWGGWQSVPDTVRFYWDHQHGHKDSHSLAVENLKGTGTNTVFYRDLKVDKPDALYHLRGMVQCSGANPDAYVGIQLRWSRADGKYLPRKYTANRFYSAKLFKEGAWTPLDVFSLPPADVGALSVNVSLAVINCRKGTFRFDDVTMATVDEKDIRSKTGKTE